MYDIQKIREDFPILDREVYGKPLIYLDNGATTQKPRQVVEAITDECQCASWCAFPVSAGYRVA